MGRQVRHLCSKLSDWECMELYVDYRRGTTKYHLQQRYRMSYHELMKTIERIEAAARGLGLSTRQIRS